MRRWTGLALFMFLAAPTLAKLDGTVYLSQGLTYNDGGHLFAQPGDMSFRFHEASINANWRVSSQWRLAGQMLYRQAGNIADSNTDIDYLFAEYRFPVWSGNVAAAAGRNKMDMGFYNASRDSLFSRPSILLPQSIYQEFGRDAALRNDGLKFSGAHFIGEQSLSWNATYGLMALNDSFADIFLGFHQGVEFDDTESLLLTLGWEYRTWLQLKASYIDTGFSVDDPRPMRDATYDIERWIVGLRGEYQRWQWSAEYGEMQVDGELTEVGFPFENTSQGGYVQTRYYLLDQLSVLARYDLYWGNKDDKGGDRFEPRGEPNWQAWSRASSLGLSWQFFDDWQLSAEWHRMDGTAVYPGSMANLSGQERISNLYMLQLAYRWNWALFH
ncbi:hypothetical protein [Ferrimonas pelagia]|uniref:Phosphate-selective porin O and P n=1 Tax=Ferrimonas pelagia TaxID=1177826 RepID=A0ABP9EBM2_9GAMM